MNPETISTIRKLQTIFRERGLRLSVAESCTGGLISHYLTSLPGASLFFDAGVVAYSAAAKRRILGVSGSILETDGLVSMATAKEMAARIRLLTGTAYSLATTGNLGPDVLESKEIGLVYAAVGREEAVSAVEMHLTGSREEIKEAAALRALRLLLEVLGA